MNAMLEQSKSTYREAWVATMSKPNTHQDLMNFFPANIVGPFDRAIDARDDAECRKFNVCGLKKVLYNGTRVFNHLLSCVVSFYLDIGLGNRKYP